MVAIAQPAQRAIADMTALNQATSQESALLQTTVDGIGSINTSLSSATATLAAQGAKLDAIAWARDSALGEHTPGDGL